MAGDPQVIPIHLTILPWHARMLEDIRQERRMIGPSETLRTVLTHYAILIGYAADAAQTPKPATEAAA